MCWCQIWRIHITDEMRPCVEKNEFDLFLVVKRVKETWLWWNSNLMFHVHISKHVEKSWEKFLLTGSFAEIPLPSVCGHQRAKNYPTMTKISQDTCYISVLYRIGRLYIIFETINEEKWLRSIFDCKVGKWPDCDETWTRCVVLPTRCIHQVSNWYLKTCTKMSGKFFTGREPC